MMKNTISKNKTREDAVGRLIIARLDRSITPEDNDILQAWLDESPEHWRIYAQYAAMSCVLTSSAPADSPDLDRAWNRVRRKRKTPMMAVRISVAALIALLLCMPLFLKKPVVEPRVQTIANIDNPSMHVELPDGTDVWLRPGSRLEYDDSFNVEERKVRLTGEAYFDVEKNPAVPFYVIMPDFRVRVLGTEFDVKLSSSGASEVVLARGSVSLQDAAGNNLFRIKPGQKATWEPAEQVFDVSETMIGDILLVKYGVISMSDVTVSQIIEEIENRYGVTVRQQGTPSDEGKRYNFNFQSGASPQSLAEQLGFICEGATFTIEE